MKRVLLIAGESFLGKHLHAHLERRGHDVIVTSRSLHHMPCDVTDASQVECVVRETAPNWIINCAGVTSGDDFDLMQRVNADGTEILLQAIARHAPKTTALLFGSAAEYGSVHPEYLPIREGQPCRPVSPYGRSKLAQTELTSEFAARQRLRVLVARPFNMVGPGLPEHFMPAALAQRLRKPSEVLPIANAHATRDWIDVRDVAAAVVALLERDVATPGHTGLYNVATEVETSVLAVATELCRLAGCRAIPMSEASFGIARSAGDATLLRRATGWSPRYSWQQSIADLWRFHQRRLPVAIS